MQRTEIPLNKSKLWLLVFFAILFVLSGIWFLLSPPHTRTPEIMIRIIGAVTILFFGFAAISIGKKLFTNTPGLIIEADVFFDSSSGVAVGAVPWSDVRGIRILQILNQQFIAVDVYDAEKYIARKQKGIIKLFSSMNKKFYDTPIQISANTLQCDFHMLYGLMQQYFSAYQNRKI